MTSKKPAGRSPKQKKPSKQRIGPNDLEQTSKLTLFDHVKHIRGIQDPNYYKNLSEENRKSFNPFMILRALAMDDEIVGEMAFLYRYFHLIPPPQFYQLLIALTPKHNRWVPWIKTKVVKHSPEALALFAKHFEVSKRQANEYVNVLLQTDDGLEKLGELCEAMGLSQSEVEKLFNKEA